MIWGKVHLNFAYDPFDVYTCVEGFISAFSSLKEWKHDFVSPSTFIYTCVRQPQSRETESACVSVCLRKRSLPTLYTHCTKAHATYSRTEKHRRCDLALNIIG